MVYLMAWALGGDLPSIIPGVLAGTFSEGLGSVMLDKATAGYWYGRSGKFFSHLWYYP
ncbi:MULTISPECIES: hypothetical protein [unclassified Microcoleus]|uniref:hypothetical protein n=1 Tax=unclassified Microcoleus TaxID=2642155 RepID=UPI002FD2402E